MKKRILLAITLLVVIIAIAAYAWFTLNSFVQSQPSVSFAEARQAHETELLFSEHFPERPLPQITHPELEATSYSSSLGEMAAIATPVDESGIRKPAVVWVTGGFGGIGEGFDEYGDIQNDQSIASFLDRGIVLYLPTFRGEHENPGVFECFYGEVEDLAAALEHVAKRPDVDPDRIYLMGHSTGGTNVLLASMLSDIPAGVVSFGGAPDNQSVVADGTGYGEEPYDLKDNIEVRLRSPIDFVGDMKVPVLYIEGSSSPYVQNANRMQRAARRANIDFQVAIIPDQDHFSVLRPAKDLLAERIAGGATHLPTPSQVQNAIRSYYNDPNTRLLIEVVSGSASVISRLLENGADPNTTNAYGMPVLSLAASSNTDPGVVEALIDAGADLNWTSSISGTPLIYASIWNQNAIPALIKSGVNINAKDQNGISALMYAIANSNSLETARALVDAGAEVNTSDSEQYSVLHYAASDTSNPEIIELLIEQGADTNARNNLSQTPLMLAAEFNPEEGVISALIDAGSKINARTEHGATALMFACFYNDNPQIIETLLDAGADPKLKDTNDRDALQFARDNEALKGTTALERLKNVSE